MHVTDSFKFTMPPRSYQRDGLKHLYDRRGAGLAHEMGLGKTKTAIDLVSNMGLYPCLIVAPTTVVGVWPEQWRVHAPHGKAVMLALDSGSVDRKTMRAKQLLDKDFSQPVIVVNYESVWREPFRSWALSQRWECVIADESHRIKSAGSKVSKFFGLLASKASRRVCLTGTPLPNGPLDIYGQARFLDPSVFGTSFHRFRCRYAVMGGYQGREVIGYQNQDEFREKFHSMFHVVRAEGNIELPEVTTIEHAVDLPESAKKIYRQMHDDLVAEHKSGVITAANALSKLTRLQQIASGYAPCEDQDGAVEVIQLHTAKQDCLRDLLDGLPADEPVVVFCKFVKDIDASLAVAHGLGRQPFEISGRGCELDEWRHHARAGHGPVLAVQYQSGSVGIDLTAARHCVFYSPTFNLAEHEQALKRTHRHGQDRACFMHHIVARGTIDRRIYAALRDKKNVVEAAIAHLKEDA